MLIAYFKILHGCALPEIDTLEISDYRRQKILSCRDEKNRLLEYGAALTLKTGLFSLGINEKEMHYDFLENGKPYFPDYPDLHFSVSHAEDMAITVFSDKNVGIDCEPIERKISDDVLKRFFLPKEAEDYKDFPLKLWVIKESISKLSGNGILKERKNQNIPLFDKRIALNGIHISLYTISKYLICTASESAEDCRFVSLG